MTQILGTRGPVALRVVAAAVAGAAAAVGTDLVTRLAYAPAVGWITASAVYLAWTWGVIRGMDPEQTAEHARHHENDATRRPSHIIVLTASLASLGGVGYLLYATSGTSRDLLAGLVGILSVAASWLTVHTNFALRYAQLYFTAPDPSAPGIDFGGAPPAYQDFAYVAFTVGMCFGVTDTGLTNRAMRMAVLSQALVSYLLGTVIIAITLNLVGGLAG